jgi:long-subunit fatty acid transport protein
MKTSGLIFTLVLGFANYANAAGFEKSVMWSGRYAGAGNAAVATVRGSEAIYFNPAGLSTGNPNVGDISLNLSPTVSQFQGPYRDNITSTSDTSTTFPFGATASYTLNDKLGVGIGAYAAAGSKVVYNDVTVIPGYSLTPDFKTDLQSIEVAIGAGYKISEDFSVGLAWRMAFANANFWGAELQTATLVNYKLDDLKDEEFAGFKLGAMYSPSSRWGIGATWRSPINFNLQGISSGQSSAGAGVQDRVGTDSSAKVVFPMQASLGGFFQAIPDLNVLAEYVYTQYSKDKTIDINAQLVGLNPISDVALNWKDQHNIRLGLEYSGFPMPIRAGYVFTSQVAVSEHAYPSLSPPGPAHTFTLGTGYGFLQQKLMINIAGEITTISGDAPVTPALTDPAGGTYSAMEYAAHLGATYNF